MKKIIKRSLMGISFLFVLTIGTFILCMFNPQWMYAEHTDHGHFRILHNAPLQADLLPALDSAEALIRRSELYTTDFQLHICLNDGAPYYRMHELVRGQAFGYGFSDIVCLGGEMEAEKGRVHLNWAYWGLVPLLAHEMTHCLQYQEQGFWGSNPMGGHPDWVWEGYAEYMARPGRDLKASRALLLEAEGSNENGWFGLPDGTDGPISYFKYSLYVQYCMEELELSFSELLAEPPREEEVRSGLLSM